MSYQGNILVVDYSICDYNLAFLSLNNFINIFLTIFYWYSKMELIAGYLKKLCQDWKLDNVVVNKIYNKVIKITAEQKNLKVKDSINI